MNLTPINGIYKLQIAKKNIVINAAKYAILYYVLSIYTHTYIYAEIVIKHQEYDMYMDIDYESILINF